MTRKQRKKHRKRITSDMRRSNRRIRDRHDLCTLIVRHEVQLRLMWNLVFGDAT